MGKLDSANVTFKLAESIYKKELKLHPDIIQLISSNILFTAFQKDRQAAMQKLDSCIKEFPNNQLLKTWKPIIKKFNRDSFLENMGKPSMANIFK